MNKLFGTGWGNAPITQSLEFVDVPVGELCFECNEPVLATDSGIMMAYVGLEGAQQRPAHRECNLRATIGGLNHQRQTCHCFHGPDDPDPPDLTRHQAALEAVRYWERSRGLTPNV